MSERVKCPNCAKEVVPESFGGKNFCPECGGEIVVPVAVAPAEKPRDEAPASGAPAESGAVIKDGMGIIENTRTKVGAVETFSDNSVVNNTTHNTTNITKIEDDTKKSVVCEISGKKVLVTSSVQCPVCGKTVSNQYYNEEKLRCSDCEKKAVAEYEKYYTEFTKDVRVIDKELREVLDAKAKSLKLTPVQVKEMELKLRKAHSGKDAHLSDIKKKDFERTIIQMYEEKITPEAAFTKVSAYAKITEDATVQCWYHAIWSQCQPKEYVDALRNATVDDYWQIYWAFAAYAKLDDIAGAVDAVDVAKEKFPENVNDVILAQAFLGICQYFSSEDEAYVKDSESYFKSISCTDSDCLFFHYERFEELDAVFAYDDYENLNVTTLLLTRKMMKHYPKYGPVRPALSPAHKDPAPEKKESVLAQARQNAAQSAPQPTAAPVQKPQPSTQKPQPAASKPQPAAQKPQAAPQKPQPQSAQSQKGIVINNTAGGPANPQVSFDNAAPVKQKKGKGGIWIILLLLVLGAAAYFVLGNKYEPVVEDEKVVEEVVTAPKGNAAPVVIPEEKPVEKPVEKPKTMAEKAKERKEAEEAAREAEKQTAQPVADLPGAADFAKGMAAYNSGDFKAAHDYFKSAGNAGHPEACYQLGIMLSTGKGSVAKNTLQSKVWLKKAASLGYEAAQ